MLMYPTLRHLGILLFVAKVVNEQDTIVTKSLYEVQLSQHFNWTAKWGKVM